MRTAVLASCLLLVGCAGTSDRSGIVMDSKGRELSAKDATLAQLAAKADARASDPVAEAYERAQADARTELRRKIRSGYKPTDEERAFLGGRDRPVTRDQRIAAFKEQGKWNAALEQRTKAALAKADSRSPTRNKADK